MSKNCFEENSRECTHEIASMWREMPVLRRPDCYLEEVSETGFLPHVKLYEGVGATEGVFSTQKQSQCIQREL